jgi:hypothetical protein
MRFGLTSAIVATFACVSLAPATAQAAWEQLGCRKVGFLVDKDVIHVGRAEGRFRSIRLQVSGNKVHMMASQGDLRQRPARRHSRARGNSCRRPNARARSERRAPGHQGDRDGLPLAAQLQRARRPCASRARPDGLLAVPSRAPLPITPKACLRHDGRGIRSSMSRFLHYRFRVLQPAYQLAQHEAQPECGNRAPKPISMAAR